MAFAVQKNRIQKFKEEHLNIDEKSEDFKKLQIQENKLF
jgi:hypothetical protein